MDFQFLLPTKIVMKKGSRHETARYLGELCAAKVLIVTDKGVKQAGLLKDIYASLEQGGIAYEEYADVKPNPRDTDCDEAARRVAGSGIEAIVAVGGGSALDTAKAIALLYTNGGTIRDYEGASVAEKSPLPVLAIPTTAGTGSEATLWSIITDTDRNYKMPIGDFRIAPKIALLDAELTASLPAHVAASTGMDALTHAIEAYTCRVASPITDGLALHAIKLIKDNLFDAVYRADNEAARENMLIGSLIAGIAFGNADTASVHCLSEAIGGLYDTPHGVANSIFLPYVFKHNIEADVKKHADVAYALGVKPWVQASEAAAEAVYLLFDLCEQLKIPKFSQIERVNPADFSKLADKCMMNWGNPDNAREMTHEAYVGILQEAYDA